VARTIYILQDVLTGLYYRHEFTSLHLLHPFECARLFMNKNEVDAAISRRVSIIRFSAHKNCNLNGGMLAWAKARNHLENGGIAIREYTIAEAQVV
jgi:hypothetical protein